MKNILIDGSVLMFRSIHNWSMLTKKATRDQLVLPSHYTYTSMVISVLKKIKVDSDDRIIIALDGRNSFRKCFYPIYKGHRKEQREKAEIDWIAHWNKIDEVNQRLQKYSKIHVIKMNDALSYEDLINSKEGLRLLEPDPSKFGTMYGIEGDDIISCCAKFWPDEECVVVTIDKDVYMLEALPNVKIFSMNLKTPKGKNGAYLVNNKPLKVLAEKIKNGDVSDNILVEANDTEDDIKIRECIIDLINLPSFVYDKVNPVLASLPEKEDILEELPFQNSLAKRYPEIYTDKNHVSYEYCKQYFEKKAKRKKKNKK